MTDFWVGLRGLFSFSVEVERVGSLGEVEGGVTDLVVDLTASSPPPPRRVDMAVVE